MGHKQPPTLMQTDNTTALGVVQNNLATKRLKSMDMIFHWLRCRAAQCQFRYYWRAGSTNRGYFVRKHHAAIHHRAIRPQLFTPKRTLLLLRHKQKQTRGRISYVPPLCFSKLEQQMQRRYKTTTSQHRSKSVLVIGLWYLWLDIIQGYILPTATSKYNIPRVTSTYTWPDREHHRDTTVSS